MGVPAGSKDAGRLGVLDGLRGIAILLVLWFHAWQQSWLRADVPLFGQTLNFNWIPETGFLGVDLFFFVSGFCLFYPYARTLFDGRAKQTLGDYAWHRARKILPSYVVAIVVLVALGFAKFGSWQEAARHIGLHLAFIHTWVPDAYGSINGAFWSLGVEVQFYVMFPLLCWAAMRLPWPTFAAMCLAAVAYRTSLHGLAGTPFSDAVSQVFGTLDLFAAGMAAAYAYRLISVRHPKLAGNAWLWTLVALAGCIAVEILSLGLFDRRALHDWASGWYVLGRTPLALSFFVLTLGSLFAVRWWRALLANPALAFLSVVSYNLYLWHPVVASYLRTQPIFPWHATMPLEALNSQRLAYALLTIACSIAFAAIPTFALERPLLRLRRPRCGRRPAAFPAAPPSAEPT